ncbi:hypothetical protein UCMB321_0122 [Pseudomonas batumici]|uniref:Uncharacterized protein n=1 Tax=Pseudomonas batumici TaxID=226910 RepID=A0A0C2IFI6_9PSED|nr:hypothetical protein UCMB321_0122 [Pseudomonas batumici]
MWGKESEHAFVSNAGSTRPLQIAVAMAPTPFFSGVRGFGSGHQT